LAGQNNFRANGYRFNHSSFKHRQLYGDAMSRKIKVELTEQQYLTVTQALHSHCLDIMADEFLSHQTAMENRVITNAVGAMIKGHEEWKEGK